MDKETQSYTLGRIVALTEASLDNTPHEFAAKCIRSPLGFFSKWFREACLKDGDHQKTMSDLVDVLDPEWVFPARLSANEQTKAWEGYNRQRATDSRAVIGRSISELRREKGITQEQLSSLSGVTSTNISKIEKGKYNVSVDLLQKLLLALGADWSIK